MMLISCAVCKRSKCVSVGVIFNSRIQHKDMYLQKVVYKCAWGIESCDGITLIHCRRERSKLDLSFDMCVVV